MTMSDPIADFLTRIRNANMAHHESVEAPASKMKKDIAEILKQEGFIRDVEYVDDNKQGIIRVFLKYGKDGERGAQAVRCFARRPPPTTMSADSSKRSNLIDVYVLRLFSGYMHVAEDV